MAEAQKPKKFTILLLTNRDSDNLGDQVIEACDISIIKTALYNLKESKYLERNDTLRVFIKKHLKFLHKDTDPRRFLGDDFRIISRAASIISNKLMDTNDPELLAEAERKICEADLVIFGGAPMFNYLYQRFYIRTIMITELAKKHNIPVIFSAVGVEGYDEDSEKCQSLKKALNNGAVKMITTRDGFDQLSSYQEKDSFEIGKVSDPAVFTREVFSDFVKKKKNNKIGIFVLRGNGFLDNGFNYTRDDAAKLWIRIGELLEEKGYDYEYITSGHFGDEAFLDYMIREYNVKSSKCVFNMNEPERLIRKVSSYSGTISTRLHPSIISYSLGVPSVGIIWNHKVDMFYGSVGYEDRTVNVADITPEAVVEKVVKAVEEGAERDNDFAMSVYDSLVRSIGEVLGEPDVKPFDYDKFAWAITRFKYKGTSEKQLNTKLQTKFRRAYNNYNANLLTKERLNAEKKVLKEKLKESENDNQ